MRSDLRADSAPSPALRAASPRGRGCCYRVVTRDLEWGRRAINTLRGAAGSIRATWTSRRCCPSSASFNTVEINYTFYRLPTVPSLLGWAGATPPHFKLALRAPRRITHILHLKGAAATTNEFLRRCRDVGEKKLAVMPFQVAPEHEVDVALLDEFIAACLGNARRVRVPQPGLAHGRGLRLPAPAQRRCVSGQRDVAHAGTSHRRLRVLPPARRRVRTGRPRTLGGRHPRDGTQARPKTSTSKAPNTKKQAKGAEFAKRLLELLGLH